MPGVDETLVGTDMPDLERTTMRSAEASSDGVVAGTQIGRYLIVGRLGAGAMGVVYSAFDPELDRRVALKLLKPRPDEHDDARSRMQREAQALAKLAHPNVVAVHDVGVHQGRVFLAMEFIAGSTLGDWLRAAPRAWREIVDVYVAAGRGLAAAHAAGLVHRDFKPDNVMIADDGRVRVMDFGLARAGQEAVGQTDRISMGDVGDALSTPLTQTGTVMGTPAYMAPEQHLGVGADAASDQFALCVALYEALYGERPFSGQTIAQVAMSVTEGAIREAPRGSSVPGRIRRVLIRGLDVDPGRRWPDVPALVAALLHDPAAKRKRWAVTAAVAGAVGAGVWALPRPETAIAPCGQMHEPLIGVWDPERTGALGEQFAASSVAYAGATFEQVSAELDAYATRWIEGRVDACEATRVRGEQSETVLDLRMACLDRSLRAIDATVDVLSKPDPGVVEGAVDSVRALPNLAHCDDLERLRQSVRLPDDPQTARAVEALEQPLARASALRVAGKYDDALALALDARAQAEATAHGPAIVRAAAELGEVRSSRAQFEPAAAEFEYAYRVALESGLPAAAGFAAVGLGTIVGKRLERFDEAGRWLDFAAAHGKFVDDVELEIDVLNARAGLLMSQKRERESLPLLLEALELTEREHGKHSPASAALLANLSTQMWLLAEIPPAREYAERSLAIWAATYDGDHPKVARAMGAVGLMAHNLPDFVEARDYYRRSSEMMARMGLEAHPSNATVLNNFANLESDEGNLEAALALHERVFLLRGQTLPAGHGDLAQSHFNLGRVLVELERAEPGLEHSRTAFAMWEKSLGPDAWVLAYPLRVSGEALLQLGEIDESIAALQGCGGYLDRRPAPDPVTRADIAFGLARALWTRNHPGDRARGVASAEAARELYEGEGEDEVKSAARVRAWLAGHG